MAMNTTISSNGVYPVGDTTTIASNTVWTNVDAAAIPIEDTDEFREFVVWLCGFTDRSEPPNQKDWDMMKDEVSAMAAKYMLRVRERRQKELKRQKKKQEKILKRQGKEAPKEEEEGLP